MATIYTHITENKSKTLILISLFLVIVISIGWFLSYIYDSPAILLIAVMFSIAQALISYYYSDSITLAVSGAQEIPRKEPYLDIHRLVENLAITAGLPKPRIYLIDDTAPNAFATGRDPNHASVAVTRGLLEKLDKNELQGVLAHELAHVGNYDIRLMMVVVVLVGIISLLADWLLRGLIWDRGGRRGREEGGQIILIIAIIGAILAPIFATLIQLAVSRKREYLADATGVLLTRYPEGLASALQKIAADREPLEVANRATAHLYIANPLKDHEGKTSLGWWASLFSTHPPVGERVKRLREMANIS
jgi:heat shock protein HtpX